tara:strand:+ start:423 stop:1790 length:1368 start_codon:yes stop_codon:yes gene_type:complete
LIKHFLKAVARVILFASSVLLLNACGGASSDHYSYKDAYLQFYNGSIDGASTTLSEVNGRKLDSAAYGDATSVFTLESCVLDLEFYRGNTDQQKIKLETRNVMLRDNEKLMMVLSGDYASPSIKEYRINHADLKDHFRLFVTSVVPDGASYDLYMSNAGATFSTANFLGRVNYQGLTEVAYWDPAQVSEDFDEGEYIVYLTLPGEVTPIFQSPTIDFMYATEYMMVLRKTTGAIPGKIEVDLVINSSLVESYADAEATAQYRVYNSLNGLNEVSVLFDDNVNESITLHANSISELNSANYGDYRLSASFSEDPSIAFDNRLVTLNQGESKAIIIYQTTDGHLTSLAFTESTLPQVYEHQLQVVNLVAAFPDIDFYFVRTGQSIETAQYQLLALDYAQTAKITLPSGDYELVASIDNKQVLLDRTELLGLNEQANYIVTVEENDTSPTGYKISLLH